MKKFGVVILSCVLLMSLSVGALAVDIKFAHFYDPMGGGALKENNDWIQETMKGFMEANPDIKVTEEIYQWDQIDTKSIMDFKAKIVHDVMMSSPQLMPRHGYVGDYLDLSPYVLKWPEEQRKDFEWSPVWMSGIQQGKQIGIPTGTHTRLTVYRRDFFEEAGLDPDKPPTSLDEVVEYAQKTDQRYRWRWGAGSMGLRDVLWSQPGDHRIVFWTGDLVFWRQSVGCQYPKSRICL